MTTLSPELTYATLAAALTGCLWMPIIFNRLREMGALNALMNPQPDVRPQADWAYRLANAHRNAIENLVVFAPLAITVHVSGLGTAASAVAAALFFWSRRAHALIYAFGVRVQRRTAFVGGCGAQATLLLRLLGMV